MPSSEAEVAAGDVLETRRVFEAPIGLLFRIWAEPEHRVRWWGPEGHALSHCSVDLRVGGEWAIAMQRVDGYHHWVRGRFTEIDEPRRVAFTYVNDDDGIETLVEIDFRAIDAGRTEMHFRQRGFADAATREAHRWGWNSGMQLLAEYLMLAVLSDGEPVGVPRINGVAADIVAARRRYDEMGKLPNEGK